MDKEKQDMIEAEGAHISWVREDEEAVRRLVDEKHPEFSEEEKEEYVQKAMALTAFLMGKVRGI